MVKGVSETAQHTMQLVEQLNALMESFKNTVRTEQPKMYRHELINNLFNHPYTKIEFVMEDLEVSRLTASRYLDHLLSMGLLKKEKLGRTNYYINQALFNLFTG